MSKDIRVIIIKLADRLHNMRTLASRPPEKQLKTSLETMNFYAPIAHRLGISDVKEEMEDLALRYLDPYGFKEIESLLDVHKDERDTFIDKIKGMIRERISDIQPPPIIEGRVKSIYSIYKKVYVKGKDFSEIYDIYAVRIILQTVVECYNVLGIIHDMFRPIPYRFKDYIAMPKPNRYQSLHTTVIGREGIPFEQQQEADDVEQISEAIKVDLAPDDVYVFTPKGDVITLPAGSNVIDFAYAIHTQVGNKMTGAKVGGRMVPFDHTLHTGDIVEILTSGSDNYGPNRNWSEIAKTNEAKAKIRAWFKRERREENIECGKAAFEKEIRRNNIAVDDEILLQTAHRQRLSSVDDLYAAIGYGGVQLSKIITRLKEEQVKQQRLNAVQTQPIDIEKTIADNNKRAQKNGVVLDGIEDCAVKYAQCCNPLPGDDIMGFITRGYGVSIHKADCQNVKIGLQGENKDRWIKAHWAVNSSSAFRATIDIIADDRTALIADITTAIASNHLPIHEINAHYLKNGNANIILTIEVSGIDQLKSIILRLQKIPGVISAERTGKQ